MIVTIDIDIENARKALICSSGSFEEAKHIERMSDIEIKDTVIRHCKCWGIKEVEVR